VYDSLPVSIHKVKSRFSDEESVVFCPVAKQSPVCKPVCWAGAERWFGLILDFASSNYFRKGFFWP
jgi:hypothetical protein